VELIAYDAFKGQDGVPNRGDIILALNRLSSLFYVMMFRALTKEYD
jgi:ethanolamine utilization cobalamin adenosyltransferase